MMTLQPIVIKENISVRDIHRTFEKHQIRHLPVVGHGGELVGIVSKTDLNRLIFGSFMPGDNKFDDAMMDMLSLEDVIVSEPVSLSPESTLEDAVAAFSEGGFHAVPVVQDGNLVGILSVVDVLKSMYEKLKS